MIVDLDQIKTDCNSGMMSRIGISSNKIFYNLAIRSLEGYSKPPTPHYFQHIRHNIQLKKEYSPRNRNPIFDTISREKREITKKQGKDVPDAGVYNPNYHLTQKAPITFRFKTISNEILRCSSQLGTYDQGIRIGLEERGDMSKTSEENKAHNNLLQSESQPLLLLNKSPLSNLSIIPPSKLELNDDIIIFGKSSPTAKHIPTPNISKYLSRKQRGGIFGFQVDKNKSPKEKKNRKNFESDENTKFKENMQFENLDYNDQFL